MEKIKKIERYLKSVSYPARMMKGSDVVVSLGNAIEAARKYFQEYNETQEKIERVLQFVCNFQCVHRSMIDKHKKTEYAMICKALTAGICIEYNIATIDDLITFFNSTWQGVDNYINLAKGNVKGKKRFYIQFLAIKKAQNFNSFLLDIESIRQEK